MTVPFINGSSIRILALLLGSHCNGLQAWAQVPATQLGSEERTRESTSVWTIQGQLTTIDTWTAASTLSGIVDEILVREGDHVELGQPIARLNDSLLQAELSAAQAAQKAALLESNQQVDIEYAQMTAAVRKAELLRSRQANEAYAKTVSTIELERQQLLVRQAELSAEQSLHKQRTLQQHHAEKSALVDLIQVKIAKTQVQSRLKGTVVEVVAKPGQWLSEGTPLLRVISRDRLRFESLVDYGLASKLKVGELVRFTLVMPQDSKESDQQIIAEGKLTFVSPEINAVTRQVRIMAEIQNSQLHLQPGMSGHLQPVTLD